MFDDTLKTALSVSLNQSPFLNVLPDNKVAATLKLMSRPAGTKLTPEVTRELCQRAGSKAYIAGSIASLGSEYVLGLKAVNCQSGDPLAEEQVTAASKEKVLDALGEAASKLRTELGESLGDGAEVRCSAVRGHHVFARSSEGVQPWQKGLQTRKAPPQPCLTINVPSSLIRILPWATWAVGNDYSSLVELGRASDYLHQSISVAGTCQRTGKAGDHRQLLSVCNRRTGQSGPDLSGGDRELPAILQRRTAIWASCTENRGSMRRPRRVTRQAFALRRTSVQPTCNLANILLALQRFDEARQIIHEAQARKPDNFILHNALYALAFLGSDSAAMAEQQQWFAGKPEENDGLRWHPTPRHMAVIWARRVN